jgi:plastocyanin
MPNVLNGSASISYTLCMAAQTTPRRNIKCLLIIAVCFAVRLLGPVQAIHSQTTQESKPDKVQVQIEGSMFRPRVLNVATGTTVTWVNHDMVPHDVSSKEAGFKSELFAQDESFSYTFTKPGTYQYLCVTHPKMTGTVVVQ